MAIQVDPALVADHYSRRENQTREDREASPIIHLKKLNNWVKSVLIRIYAQAGDRVLDLACGKGGDLVKWDKARISHYVGVDIAKGSVEDARLRYEGVGSNGRGLPYHFSARLLCADCWKVSLEEPLKDDAPFDIISCQFALHYSFSEEARARRALQNVSSLLRPGGVFIGTIPDANVLVRKLREAPGLEVSNSVYRFRFDDRHADKRFPAKQPYGNTYIFALEDAIASVPEALIPFSALSTLAEEYGLTVEVRSNFHSFIAEHSRNPEFAELLRTMGVAERGKQMSAAEWDAAYLYLAFVFRKVGEAPRSERPKQPGGIYKPIQPHEIVFIPS
ncbi:mRNA capping enzyme family protein [Klebsormidium nitens]|uniref:mRNA (guanine-N(7))-methyltransferase n=1 Tax=Klebsormidium nitens TaxID=105231 RepID=A0A1Y1HWI6_KLENI|nr:mRNA capping enzyme family protein [Klebsormidium nitens]|eukprot:GAQ81341.1 mRNA capping enzyme family protein [Klebsormidium nitens]